MVATRTPRAPRARLEITHELIDGAIPRDSSHCMIAEAVKMNFPDASHIAVDIQTIRFSDLKRGLRYTYLTPRVAQVCLIKFDQGFRPEPFGFQLRNGQVTRAGLGTARALKSKTLSAKQHAQRVAAGKKGQAELKKARLVSRNPAAAVVPDRIGGRTPPTTPFARRRAFGLRGLDH